jgi:hypothetical protein
MTAHSRGRTCPSLAFVSPSKTEGAGNAGCWAHPQPRVWWWVTHALVTAGLPKHSGIPCAMVYRLMARSPRSAGLVSLRRLPGVSGPVGPTSPSGKLDTSVGVPGPRVFAVRLGQRSSRAAGVHRIPHPTSVTIAIRPSDGCRMG